MLDMPTLYISFDSASLSRNQQSVEEVCVGGGGTTSETVEQSLIRIGNVGKLEYQLGGRWLWGRSVLAF